MSNRLETVGITTQIRLWSDGERWREFNVGSTGPQTQATAEWIAATAVLSGAAQPASSWASLAASIVGDREPIAQLIPAAQAEAAASSPAAERDWRWTASSSSTLAATGSPTSTAPGCWSPWRRSVPALRCGRTSKENHTSHMAIWNGLARHAPDEVRAAPASMLGFASWLHGDGAKAWCALDQVPADRPYSMAAIVASALQNGIHPREWTRYQTQIRDLTRELDESFVPKPPEHQHDVPRAQPTTDRPAPGR